MKQNSFRKTERNDLSDFNCHWCSLEKVNAHLHTDYYEIIIATDKDFYNRINGTDRLQKVKDVVILKPGVTHEMLGIGGDGAIHYNIAVKEAYLKSFWRNKEGLKSHIATNDAVSVTLNDTAFAYVRTLLDIIDNDRRDTLGIMRIETVLYTIFHQIMEDLRYADTENGQVSSYCKDAVLKIDNHTLIALSVKDIIKQYPVSHTSFIAQFKKLCGMPPSDYLAERKWNMQKHFCSRQNCPFCKFRTSSAMPPSAISSKNSKQNTDAPH